MSTPQERARADAKQSELAAYLDAATDLEHLAALPPIEYDRRREAGSKEARNSRRNA
jgi:hypothetical protein